MWGNFGVFLVLTRNCLAHTLDYIVMQIRKTNREKGYSELSNLYSWRKANELSLTIEFIVVSSRQKILSELNNIQWDNQPISRVEHAKSLGLITDYRLLLSNHIREPRQSVLFSALGPSFLNQLQYKYITPFIQPHFDNFAPVQRGIQGEG